jgi:hypothetical protein
MRAQTTAAQTTAARGMTVRRTAPMSPGTRTCPATCTLTREDRTGAQLTWTRTTVLPVQRAGPVKICLPGLACLCRARPLLLAAPARSPWPRYAARATPAAPGPAAEVQLPPRPVGAVTSAWWGGSRSSSRSACFTGRPGRLRRNRPVPARSRRSSRRPCGRERRRSAPAGRRPRPVAAPTRRRAPVTGSRTRCARLSRHATGHVGSPPAVSLRGGASRTTRSPTAGAARPAHATCRPNAAGITTSSTCRAGGSTSPGREFSPGPPRPG